MVIWGLAFRESVLVLRQEGKGPVSMESTVTEEGSVLREGAGDGAMPVGP